MAGSTHPPDGRSTRTRFQAWAEAPYAVPVRSDGATVRDASSCAGQSAAIAPPDRPEKNGVTLELIGRSWDDALRDLVAFRSGLARRFGSRDVVRSLDLNWLRARESRSGARTDRGNPPCCGCVAGTLLPSEGEVRVWRARGRLHGGPRARRRLALPGALVRHAAHGARKPSLLRQASALGGTTGPRRRSPPSKRSSRSRIWRPSGSIARRRA